MKSIVYAMSVLLVCSCGTSESTRTTESSATSQSNDLMAASSLAKKQRIAEMEALVAAKKRQLAENPARTSPASIDAELTTSKLSEASDLSKPRTSGITVGKWDHGRAIGVCATPSVFMRMMRYREINDTYGLSELHNSGLMYAVDLGTPVLVIETDGEFSEVRILEGNYRGKSGWVYRGLLVDHSKRQVPGGDSE